MLVDCDACSIATEDAWSGRYDFPCLSCEARSLAHSPAALEAYRDVNPDPYNLRAAMRKFWHDTATYEAGKLRLHQWHQILYPRKRT